MNFKKNNNRYYKNFKNNNNNQINLSFNIINKLKIIKKQSLL